MTTAVDAVAVPARVSARPLRPLRNLNAKIAAIPMVLTSLVIYLGCTLWSVYYSFTNSKLLPRSEFVGWVQYDRLFTTTRWFTAMHNIVVYGILMMVMSLVIGFLLAAFMDQRIRFESTFRTIFLHPFAMSFIVTGLVWQWILNPTYGIQKVVNDLGWHSFVFDWLVRTDTAIYTVAIAALWQGTGLVMALMLAGLRGIDDEIWKAARVDGIPTWKTYVFIVIPMMRPVLVTTVILVATGIVRVYDLIVAQTGGGPGTATDMPAKYVIDMMFSNKNIAQGLAASTVMLLAVLVLILPWQINEYRRRRAGRL